jgi:hypothetical protein
MNKIMYNYKVRQFESKYHIVLVNTFKQLNSYWESYRIKYNNKYTMDYTSFVRYCFSITSEHLK